MREDPTQEGTIAATVSHPHTDWPINKTNYRFDLPSRAPIFWRAAKTADRTLSVWVVGPFLGDYNFQVSMPPCPDGQLQIGLSWAKGEVKLYLDGKLAQTRARDRS